MSHQENYWGEEVVVELGQVYPPSQIKVAEAGAKGVEAGLNMMTEVGAKGVAMASLWEEEDFVQSWLLCLAVVAFLHLEVVVDLTWATVDSPQVEQNLSIYSTRHWVF